MPDTSGLVEECIQKDQEQLTLAEKNIEKFRRFGWVKDADPEGEGLKEDEAGSSDSDGQSSDEDDELPIVADLEWTARPSKKKVNEVLKHVHAMRKEELIEALKAVKYRNFEKLDIKMMRKEVRRIYRAERLLNLTEDDDYYEYPTARYLDYIIAVDLECTCGEILFNYPHELIEFPAVLIDVRENKIASKFRTYIRPTKNPELDAFCVRFCKISQATIDSAPFFREALDLFYAWIYDFLKDKKRRRFAIATDGPNDFFKFFQYQCYSIGHKMPHILRSYINVKKIFHFRCQNLNDLPGKSGIVKMLGYFRLSFRGHQHSGLYDALNLAMIIIAMNRRRIELRVNEKCSHKRVIQKGIDMELETVEAPPELVPMSREAQRVDWDLWREKLPLARRPVFAHMGLFQDYLDCDSCDEKVDNEHEKGSRKDNMRVRIVLENMFDEYSEQQEELLKNNNPDGRKV